MSQNPGPAGSSNVEIVRVDESRMRWTTEASATGVRELPGFERQVAALFDVHFARLHRVMNRLSGEPELAADLTQEAFVRLYQRGSLPDRPEAWLISVAMNLFRNEYATRNRRRRLLTVVSGESEGTDTSAAGADQRRRVREALDRLPERDRQLLVLSAEGYRYHDLAAALGLHEASVGVFLARARRAFREVYGEHDAPR